MGLYNDDNRIGIRDWILSIIIVSTITTTVITSTVFTVKNLDNPELLVPIVFAALYIVAFSVSVIFYIIEIFKRSSIHSVLNDMTKSVNSRKILNHLGQFFDNFLFF